MEPHYMRTRAELLERIAGTAFDVCIVGGGATGSGCALEAQLRGLKTVVIESGDFGSGSSTASTKMAHGGVRYLQQAVGNFDIKQFRLLKDALRERAGMLHNAPYLTRSLEFLVPCFSYFEKVYYGLGMKMYDWMSGKSSLCPSRILSREEALSRMPAMQSKGLAGAVAYADGQFDDARYAMALIETFVALGGAALNYTRVTGFERGGSGKLGAAVVCDRITDETFTVRARAFINATGPYSDAVRSLANPSAIPRMRPSKGVHIVVPLDGFSENDALLVPETEDGRMIFAIPWNGRLLVGTTETEYIAGEQMIVKRDEVDYLLRQVNPYLKTALRADQVISGFAGIRPLVAAEGVTTTKSLIRDAEVELDEASGLISILGGKWTTYRSMGEETIDGVQEYLGTPVSASPTEGYALVGSEGYSGGYWEILVSDFKLSPGTARHLASKYGTRAEEVLSRAVLEPSLMQPIVAGQAPICAQVIYAVREEMALAIEDVLARRIGLELYGWRLAIQAAPVVGRLMGQELRWSAEQEATAVQEYVRRVDRLIESAA